ncbi:MAG: hypothetical protein Aurels2KO_33670 [Aureliella sp.]
MKSPVAVFRYSFSVARIHHCAALAIMLLLTATLAPRLVAQENQASEPASSTRAQRNGDEEKPKKKIFSGPQVGEKLGEFPVWEIPSGDSDSKKVDLREIAGKTPLTIAVMHGKTRPAFMMWRALNAYGQKLGNGKMRVFCVMLSDDRSSEDQWLRGIRKRQFPKGGDFAIADGGLEGPGAIGLNRTASMTILVVKDGKVTANYALTQVTAQVDAPKILESIAKAAGEKNAPSLKDLLPQANRMQRTRGGSAGRAGAGR